MHHPFPPHSGPAADRVPEADPSFVSLRALQPRPSEAAVEQVRSRLNLPPGKQFWRSLEELHDTEEFRTYLEREFPQQAPGEWEPLGRRQFLQVMGATLALAGVGGCALQPAEKIVPFLENPEQVVPGKPLFYATTFDLAGYGRGVVAEAHMGRPIKLEGNSEHPASLGATDAVTQASVLTLYDPDRSQSTRRYGTPTSWEAFQMAITGLLEELRTTRGEGFRLLMGAFTSPTLEAQCRTLLARYPKARIHTHEPGGRDQVHAGCQMAFGRPAQPVYHLNQATRILALDADFLVDEPGSVRYARDFAAGRRPGEGQHEPNRLFVAECTPSVTGVQADHRVLLKSGAMEALARAVLAGIQGSGEAAPPAGIPAPWLQAVVADLKGAGAHGLVIAGSQQSAVVHALTGAINSALGSIGTTVTYTAPVEVLFGNPGDSLKELVQDIGAGKVKTLVILGCNPAYSAPADLQMAEALQRVPLRIHMGLYDDETASLCHWHVPQTHYLESWSDIRAYDGTASLVQPLIEPLYECHSPHELLALLTGVGPRPPYELVREHWMRMWGMAVPGPAAGPAGSPMRADSGPRLVPSDAFESRWHEALNKGVIAGTAARAFAGLAARVPPVSAPAAAGPELLFRLDPTIRAGQFANNGWLQELPKCFTALTWDNALLLSPADLRSRNLTKGDLVEITYQNRTLQAAVWELVGQPAEVFTLHLGYGRTRAGSLGNGAGFSAYTLLGSDAPWGSAGVDIRKVGGSYPLASAQMHFSMEGREFVKVGTFAELHEHPEDPHFMHSAEHIPSQLPSLYPQMWPSDRTNNSAKGNDTWEAEGYNENPVPAWGLTVDLTACIGCSACTIACQAENNIATVGRSQVRRNREMHWMRVDTWFEGSPEDPHVHFQPVMCMHCEKAPCEPVCPVGATTHSAEGINEMVYNRCVGTRYCANNCPYKVRRFNYLQFSDQQTGVIQMLANPDVTVRSRGVMEKCTYCIQRINQARIEAEKEERDLADGDVVTACQQVCPTQAIVFGNLNDPKSKIHKQVASPLNYTLLTELNTRPRTSYLARLRNPHPSLEQSSHTDSASGTAHPAGGTGGH